MRTKRAIFSIVLAGLMLVPALLCAAGPPPPFPFIPSSQRLLPLGCTNGYTATYSTSTGLWGCTAMSGAGDLKADGSVPLTANWNVGAYTITASGFVGNASTATALAANPADCAAGQLATGIAANGDLTCSANPSLSTLNLVAANALNLGTGSSIAGEARWKNATNNYYFSITGGVPAGGANIGWTTPTAAPAGNNYLVKASTAGVLDYTDPATFQAAGAKLTAIQALASAAGYLKNDGAGNFSYDNPAGAGDFKADGTVPMTAAIVPNAANTIALGSTSAEWADLYLGDGAVIYGQNDQSNTLTSSATGWGANLLFTVNAGLAVKNGSTSAGFIDFYEDSDDGTNYHRIMAAAMAGNVTTYLPNAAGATGGIWYFSSANQLANLGIGTANQVLQTNSGATAPEWTSSLTISSIAMGTGYISFGADPADAGALRFSNADKLMWEASAAGTDVEALSVDSSEVVQIGAAGASGVTITPATTITGTLTVGETNGILVGATGVKITSDNDGAITFTGNSAGYDEDLTINLDDTENTAVVSSSTGVTKIDFSALNLATKGTVAGSVPVLTKDTEGANTFTGEEFRGAMVLLGHADAISDITLPDYDAAASAGHAKIGDVICFYAISAYAHTIHPAADDKIRTSNGTLNGAGAGVTYTTASTPVGGYVCFMLTDAASDVGHWSQLGMNGTWPIH